MKKEKTRKEYLKDELLKHLKTIHTDKNRKIYMNDVFNPSIMKGSFKDYLKGDLHENDKKDLSIILSELKKEKVIYHIAKDMWVLI